MSGPFAKGTDVPVSKSRAEIENMLARYGASGFAGGWTDGRAVIVCEAKGRRVRFELPLPVATEKRFTHGTGRLQYAARTKDAALRAYDGECRRLWRSLALVIKAKLESVESGIETFEQAFLANIVVPGTGETFGDWAAPRIADAYARGAGMPPLLGVGS